jgi:hypothetical protein
MGVIGEPRIWSREAREVKILMWVSLLWAKENPLGGGLVGGGRFETPLTYCCVSGYPRLQIKFHIPDYGLDLIVPA